MEAKFQQRETKTALPFKRSDVVFRIMNATSRREYPRRPFAMNRMPVSLFVAGPLFDGPSSRKDDVA